MLVDNYLAALNAVLADLPRAPLAQVIAILKDAQADQRRVFVFGNGGSAATASHMVCDLGKNTVQDGKPRLRISALNDNMPTFSAYANDEGYDLVFAQPIQTLAEPGDVVIAISGSGNSPNVLCGVQIARQRGLITVGLTGFAGGQLKSLVDVCVIVPSDNIQYVEDAHLVINHILTRALCDSQPFD